MGSVKVAIVGEGICPPSLVQAVENYKDADPPA